MAEPKQPINDPQQMDPKDRDDPDRMPGAEPRADDLDPRVPSGEKGDAVEDTYQRISKEKVQTHRDEQPSPE